MSENEGVSLGIKKIKDLSFIIRESLYKGESELISIDFEHKIGLKKDESLLSLTLRIVYYYPGNQSKTILLEAEIENVFFVSNLNKYVNDRDEITFEEQVWVTMVSLSVSHSRALLAKNCAGTVLQETLLPIINPVDLTRSILLKSTPESYLEIKNEKGELASLESL